MMKLSDKSRPGIINAKFVVCKEYGITDAELYGLNRNPKLVEARQIVWWFEHRSGKKLWELAYEFNRKSHATILSGIRTMNVVLEVDKTFRQRFEAIKQQILN